MIENVEVTEQNTNVEVTQVPATNLTVTQSAPVNLALSLPGPQGAAGPPSSLAIGTVETAPEGTQASATITGAIPNQIISFVIPKGDTGDTGPIGEPGPANNLTLGSVNTGAAGSNVIVNISGSPPNQVISFTIPRGDTGPQGIQGIQGEQGPQGIQGPVGPAGLEWRGVWSDTADYVVDDAVSYNYSSWFASADPPVGEIPSDASAYWQILAARGEQGPQGPQGIQGEQGPQGEPGTGSVSSVNGYVGPDVIIGATDITTGVFAIAQIPTGTSSTTVALGDHLHTGIYEPVVSTGTINQFYRGDKTWQAIDKTTVGLANVDNTSDVDKPVSTATQTALDGKASASHSHTKANITDFAHTHTKAEITDFAHSHLITDLPVAASGVSNASMLVRSDDVRLSDSRTPLAHAHTKSEITDFAHDHDDRYYTETEMDALLETVASSEPVATSAPFTGNSNEWTKIATLTIDTAAYVEGVVTFAVVGLGGIATFTASLSYWGSAGDASVDLKVFAADVYNVSGLRGVIVQDDASATVREIWVQNVGGSSSSGPWEVYELYRYNDGGTTGHDLVWNSNQPWQTIAPEGLSYTDFSYKKLPHTHIASDITLGTFVQARIKPNVQRFVFTTGSEARPTGSTYVEWVGPVQPVNALDNDSWVNTA